LRKFDCFCGTTIEADDLDSLIAPARAHMNEAHGFGLTDANTRDYFEAEDRLSPVRPRLDEIGEVEIHAATPDRLEDVLHFFDYDGFAGKAEWAACYCMAHHIGEGGPDWCRANNRALLVQQIADGTTTGFLAYADANVAAWVNASPRSAFVHYAGRDEHPDDEVGSIVCFVVSPPYRRHGLAQKLLETACSSFVERGLKVAEAYPNAQPSDDASAYHGPLSMYLDAGFAKVGELQHLTVVQKPL
jgi:ribosomal protein S18 acetylase RimI-like enzyme